MAPRRSRSSKPGDGADESAGSALPEMVPDNARAVARLEPTRLIVGIGASAGGLDAFRAFFARMPADTGMAFVLVQHLDPNYDSSLVAIVDAYTGMAVHLAEDGIAVSPNQVYIIPPDAILTISGGNLHLTRPAPPAARRTSINTFLTSLAQDQGENAVGVILSGFGSDGALGVVAIKEHGGLTLSQAEFDHHAKSGMPQSAASSGFVDHVLSVEEMPAALLEYQRHRKRSDRVKGPDGVREDLATHLVTICAVLQSRLGRDFSQYKPGTLMRRIQRRMQVLQTDEVPSYIEQLRTRPNEAELLFRELLIGVTRFFRDAAAFEALETKVIPGMLADPSRSDQLRVWVAGCATGEEAYSIAILLKEGLARSGSRRPVQIFATDVDDRAIQAARAGLYLGSIASDLPAERLERNFVREDSSYRVAKDIREMCLFSTHDLVKDPPFSRLDLVSCRNLMIYFEPRLQQRVVTTFHYALRPGCHLFLGPSESITAQARLFAPLDNRHRLFARRDTAASFPALSLSRSPGRLPPGRRAATTDDNDIERRAARAMARYAPAFLVVDRQYDVLRFSGQTAKYLDPTPGVASLNLFTLLHTDLRPAARAALSRAAATGTRVLHDNLSIEAGENYATVNLIVELLPDREGEGLFVLAFQEVGHIPKEAADAAGDAATEPPNGELLATRERLRNVSEELEAANEELQSSNEEYLSVNEELQSANEELETSKEELQSLNEELQTINAELNTRNDTLVRANSDLANLLDSTSIATLFLDSELRIRRFTPPLLEIFKVREGDEGRPIGDIVTRLSRDGLGQDVQQVLRTLVPIEREMAVAEDGVSYLVRIRPYRDLNNVIDGAVITFTDISERKQHEQARALLAAIVESSQDAIVSHDLEGIITSWNAGAEQLFGHAASVAIGQSISILLGEALPDDWARMRKRLEQGEQIARFESASVVRNGHSIAVSITISPIRDTDGHVAGASVVARNISERRAAEQKTGLLLDELDHRVKNILAIVSAVVTQTAKGSITPEAFAAEIEGRIQSIAKAHTLLSRAGQSEIALRALITTELAPYDRQEGTLVIAGPDVALKPKAGLALAMAIHELASNAAKYGALSTVSGRLEVRWTVTSGTDKEILALAWTESGGPAVQPPVRRGFGTTLIERALTHELDAEVRREFAVPGLRCTIEIPLTEEVGRVRPARYPRSA